MEIFNKNNMLDPSFKKWEPLLPDDNKQNLNAHISRVENDIALNKYSNNTSFNKLFPKKKQLVRVNLMDENNRFNVMSQELMDKDEKIQELKNEVLKMQMEINDVEKEKNIYDSKILENQILRKKLNEQYDITKEIPEYQYEVERLMIQKKSNDETIDMLKKIIHKQQMIIIDNSEKLNNIRSTPPKVTRPNFRRSNMGDPNNIRKPPPNVSRFKNVRRFQEKPKPSVIEEVISDEEDNMNSSSDDESSEEENDNNYSSEEENEEEEKKDEQIYKNETLKDILCNYDFDKSDIDQLFIDMKITEEAKITKKLISTILNYLQNN